jgi:hypothetical protein|uniref:Uncharacterized protein n=1 Tax=viral metagenome TaxID=1070528 RepID=A0A6C0IBU4_9ZZZZ
MDDFVLTNLQDSRNEWCSRLVSIFCPLVIEGMKSIFNEAWKICIDTNEPAKYLMTYQNFLSRVPKWNSVIVEDERKRIIERSGCNYLEDLITCVHIIQLKVLTCIRVGNKQKKIDITIPKLDHFIHKVYIHVARKIYMNIYLFEKNITPLQMQKNGRELEIIVQECILTTIRESIPTEEIIRAYMDESIEHEEEVTIEPFAEPVVVDSTENHDVDERSTDILPSLQDDLPVIKPSIQDLDNKEVVTKLSFDDVDMVLDSTNKIIPVNAPKTLERLEEISVSNALQRKLEEEDDMEDRIQIHTDSLDFGDLGILDLNHDQEKPRSILRKDDNDSLDMSLLGIENI